jgi:hypothetical protein
MTMINCRICDDEAQVRIHSDICHQCRADNIEETHNLMIENLREEFKEKYAKRIVLLNAQIRNHKAFVLGIRRGSRRLCPCGSSFSQMYRWRNHINRCGIYEEYFSDLLNLLLLDREEEE